VMEIRIVRVHGVVDERREERTFFGAHQSAARRVFDFCDLSSQRSQQLCVVPETGASLHQMAVIIGDAFGDPQTAGVGRSREIPWSKLNWPKALDVPDMKEFVSEAVNRRFQHSRVAQR